MKDQTRACTVSYEVFMLALCLFALVTFAITSLIRLDPGVRVILQWADNAVCMVFLVDFATTFWRAEDRRKYFLTWGWIDLLSSVPVVDGLRFGRIARIWRVVRVLRGARAAKLIASFILERRSQNAFFAATLTTLLLVVFSSIAILEFERGQDANIRGPLDALWWTVSTITTVGYGDRYPVTTPGRVVGAVVMIGGVCLMGTVSGMVAAWFLAPAAGKQDDQIGLLRDEIAALREEVREIGKG